MAAVSYVKIPLAEAIKRALPEPAFRISEERLEKLKSFSKVLLGILAVAGIVSMVVLAPNALQALEIFQKRKNYKPLAPKRREAKLIKTFYYLKTKGFIEFRQKGEDYEITLTDTGKKQVRKLNLETLRVSKSQRWDGKFWQVAADVPTKKYRRGADALRAKLKQMGFYPLQRTLWFYPYDPRVEVEFIARFYGIGPFVTTMKVFELDASDERVLKKFFKRQGII